MSETISGSNASVSCNPPNGLSTIVYRSRATRPLTAGELLDLTNIAQRRNRAEAITGLILYDDAWFFQWLEGPDDAVARMMQSINSDARHTDIEVLTWRPTAKRNFHSWNMKLALAEGSRSPWTSDVITPPPTLLAALRRQPERAVHLLESLASPPGSSGRLAVLETVIRTKVVPRLLQAQFGARLADLLRADDVTAATALVRSATAGAEGLSAARAALFTAAAQNLGDGWSEDSCTELDVSLGLFTLHNVMRKLDQPSSPNLEFAGAALVTPQSGEPHSLGAAMSAQRLRATGWEVRCEFPTVDSELSTLLKDTWFDRLDLSLSPAHERLDQIGALKTTIAMARLASLNPALNVAVGGRAFAEDAGLAARVGADPQPGG